MKNNLAITGKKVSLTLSVALFLTLFSLNVKSVLAFCGFFVAKVDANLFNNRSEVAISNERDRATYSLSFDYKGDPKEFALILPVPVILKKPDVKVIPASLFQRLNDFTAPRLVRYEPFANRMPSAGMPRSAPAPMAEKKPVQVVERFSVGEYDVVILSATESNALATWLEENQYKIPQGSAKYLKPYVDQKLYFFVVKVNIKEQQKLGFNNLRPIQFTVPAKEIMLPFQLGKINSEGTQDIIVYFLSDKGRVEAQNYTNVMIPSNFAVPQEIEANFGQFYKDLLTATIKATRRETVVTEYAWDTGSCDPCSAQPLDSQELKQLGMNRDRAFITRLHLQYTKDTYNKDLVFRVTSDNRSYQGRYILTPKNVLINDKNAKSAEIKAPYGKQLSTVNLPSLFNKYGK